MPGAGRSPGEEIGKILKYSCLENSMDREAWQARVHTGSESDMTQATQHVHVKVLLNKK